MTASVADSLTERGILLNTVNPGPVNTGYLDEETRDRPAEVLREVFARFPRGGASASLTTPRALSHGS